MTEIFQEIQRQQTISETDSSSYLSQCFDDEEQEDFEMALALKNSIAKKHQQQVMKKPSTQQDFSTSEFSLDQEEPETDSLQSKRLTYSGVSGSMSPNSDPSNKNIKTQNKSNNYDQDILDIHQMLKILDSVQDQNYEQKDKINQKDLQIPEKNQTKSYQNTYPVKQMSNQQERPFYKNYQPFRPQQKYRTSNNLNKFNGFHVSSEKQYLRRPIPKYPNTNRQNRMSHKFHTSQYPYEGFRPYKQNYPFYESPVQKNQPIRKGTQQFASQNYLFYGVLVSIKLASFMSISKNVLVCPFSNDQFSDPVSKIIQSKIKYNLKQIALKQAKKCDSKSIIDGNVFSVKAKGLERNYRGIYFLKSPQNSNQSLKYYDLSILKKGIDKIFTMLDSHKENHVVFPQFEWGCFSKGEICEQLINGIFRQLNKTRKSYYCANLKQVIICVSNCQTFEAYSKYLRSYVRQMIG